jgi:hypothetical protein
MNDVIEQLSDFNTAPDGSEARSIGTRVLYGPGYIVELPTATETISQALVNVNDEESAWPVLSRLCKNLGWKMQDAKTGQVFG